MTQGTIQIDTDEFDSAETIDGLEVTDGAIILEESDQLETPDSTIHHWPMMEGGGSTLTDEVNGEDGDISGPSWVDGDWIGGYALDATETSGSVVLGLEDLISVIEEGCTILLTVQDVGSDEQIFGEEGNEPRFRISTDSSQSGQAGRFNFNYRGPNDNWTAYYSETDISDGGIYRLGLRITDIDDEDVDLWVNGEEDTASGGDPARHDGNMTFSENFTEGLELFSVPDRGEGDFIADNLLICDEPLSNDEIESDYNSQPWV